MRFPVQIKSLWNKLSGIGIEHVETLHDKKAVIIMNRMSFVLATFMLVFAINAIIFKDYLVIPFAFFFCINFLITPVLISKGFFTAAKWFFAITPIVEVSIISIINGENGGDKFYLITTGIIPVMVFRSKWLGFLFFALSIICLFTASYLQTHIKPFVLIDENIMQIYRYTNYLAICMILYLFTRYFKNDTERIEKELVLKNDEITEKHKEITDSINYAERIQRSFMATQQLLSENLPSWFLYFNPKEAVSGDFYWAASVETTAANGNASVETTANDESNHLFFLAVADSTGHGVPGAIMSILNITCLENAVKEGHKTPAAILNHARSGIIERLSKDGSAEGGKDGMDCSLIALDVKTNKLSFALANNPLWLFRKNGGQYACIEFAPDKMPVGRHDKQHVSFTHHETEMKSDDIIFLFTDGYPDQFGGPKGKKFKYAQLKQLLSDNLHLEMPALQGKVRNAFNDWKGKLEQTDDVCLMGIRLGGD